MTTSPAAMWWPPPRVPVPLLIKIRRFTVLAIESSADDTCAAVVASSGEILSNVVVKQNYVCVPMLNHLHYSHPCSCPDMNPLAAFTPTRQSRLIKKTWLVRFFSLCRPLKLRGYSLVPSRKLSKGPIYVQRMSTGLPSPVDQVRMIGRDKVLHDHLGPKV